MVTARRDGFNSERDYARGSFPRRLVSTVVASIVSILGNTHRRRWDVEVSGRYKDALRGVTQPAITPSNALKSLLRKRERNCKYVWSLRKQTAEVWKLAGHLTSKTSQTHHVDHEVPLSGQNAERPIRGLTVPANLRVMPARYNLSKGASFSDEDAARVEDKMMYELRGQGYG